MRPLLKIILFLLFLSTGWSCPLAQAAETIKISPGHQKVIPAPGIIRAAIGNPKVADVKALPQSDQVVVNGISVGSTDLILWFEAGKKKSYAIVVSTQTKDRRHAARQLLRGIEGIRTRKNGGKLVIEGEVYRGEDLERIQRVTEMYPFVVNLTRINGRALHYFSQQAIHALRQAGLLTVQVNVAGDELFLEGEVGRKQDVKRAERIVSSIYPKISNHLQAVVEREPMVLVDIKLMEVRKSSMTDAGIRWPGSIDADGTALFSGAGASASATLGQGSVISLLTLVESGHARILSNPKLLCRNQTPALFSAGGEIPIRLVSERTASVIFKPYGINLQVTAHSGHSTRVMLEIETRISDLDSSTALDGIPGILEHKVQTATDLQYGETVILAGLLENRMRKNVRKVPILGHVPILGELFKSRSFQRNESEFVILLTPYPGHSGHKVHRYMTQRAHKEQQRAKKDLEFSLLD